MQLLTRARGVMVVGGIVTVIIILTSYSRINSPTLRSTYHGSNAIHRLGNDELYRSNILSLDHISTHRRFTNFSAVQSARLRGCSVPIGGFKSWNTGVVTAVKPEIERNCTKIFAGDKEEIQRIVEKSKSWKNELTDKEFLVRTKKCDWVVDYFYDNLYTTKLEESFPIAYIFVVYNSPQQVMRLLKFLYRPTNVYCIHPDKKSTMMVGLFRNLATCLDNIFIASNLFKVSWGDFSLLQAQMGCHSDLIDWRSKQPEQKQWKYVINLCGKELPLKSTHTIVSYLTKLNGTSSIMMRPSTEHDSVERLRGKKLPHNFLLYKSMTYVALSYQFVHFMLKNSTAIELYHFFKECDIAEEHFYATLYRIPGVPGGYDSNKVTLYIRVSMYTWLIGTRKKIKPCAGRNIHSICIVTVGDLKMITEQFNTKALFHNKYFMEDDHTIMDCMEERLVGTNKMEYEEDCSHKPGDS